MKFFLTILSILISQLSFSQMRVEDIKNDWDVARFVNKNYNPNGKSEWRPVSHCFEMDTIYKYYPALKHFYDSICHGSDWFKIDLNKDGKLDLVVCSCIGNYRLALVILSNKEKKYRTVNISKGDYNYNPQFLNRYGDSMIVFESIRETGSGNGGVGFIVKADTVQFSENNLTEINRTKTYRKIDSISISFDIALRGGSQNLAIDKNGRMVVTIKDVVRGDHFTNKYPIPPGNTDGKAILRLAENLPYYKYLNNYQCNTDDGFSWDTEIYFADGTNMKIVDHLGVGPFGLRCIYNYAFSIFNNENDKTVSD